MNFRNYVWLAPFLLTSALFAQAIDTPFQVRYASNLQLGDSYINITNTGASSTVGFPTLNGNICVNVYAFSPDEQLVSCCSCVVTPNGLASLSTINDLISNTLTPGVPTSIVIKLLATSGGTSAAGATTCDPGTAGGAGNVLTTGMLAWGTTLHRAPAPLNMFGTETAFSPATLSGTELIRVTRLCGFIQAVGSGFGICRSCRLGGLGSAKQ